MNQEIDAVIEELGSLQKRVRDLADLASREYSDIGARVDLLHAEHQIKSASSFVNRLRCNGRRAWDEQSA